MALGEHVDGTTNPNLEATLPPHSPNNYARVIFNE